MLNLDALADLRAQNLNQDHMAWRQAVWSVGFQRLSQDMSDGEVEKVVLMCPSVGHLESVVRTLEIKVAEWGVSPFAALEKAAESAGATLEAWVLRQTG